MRRAAEVVNKDDQRKTPITSAISDRMRENNKRMSMLSTDAPSDLAAQGLTRELVEFETWMLIPAMVNERGEGISSYDIATRVGAVMRDVPMTSEGRDDLLTLTANHMNVLVHKADQAKGLSL